MGSPSHPWKVKIGDLGLARGIDSDEATRRGCWDVAAGGGLGDRDG